MKFISIMIMALTATALAACSGGSSSNDNKEKGSGGKPNIKPATEKDIQNMMMTGWCVNFTTDDNQPMQERFRFRPQNVFEYTAFQLDWQGQRMPGAQTAQGTWDLSGTDLTMKIASETFIVTARIGEDPTNGRPSFAISPKGKTEFQEYEPCE